MKVILGLATGMVLAASGATAASLNSTGLVTPGIIFGSGNANGSFSGDGAFDTFELGLRAKLRYDLAGLPQNTFNYDGDRTYTFSPDASNPDAGFSAFNFEWSVNTDPQNMISDAFDDLDDLTYLLQIDYDPTAGTDFVEFDPINVLFADHAIGTNATPDGGGTVAADFAEYAALIATSQVAQNSWNLGFFEPAGFDPQTEGIYTINFYSYFGRTTIGSASIDIVYGEIPSSISVVPLPASLPMLGLALVGFGAFARRKRTVT